MKEYPKLLIKNDDERMLVTGPKKEQEARARGYTDDTGGHTPMREYPKMMYKSKEEYIIVQTPLQEQEKKREGYRNHWNPDITPIPEYTEPEVTEVVPAEIELPPIAPRYLKDVEPFMDQLHDMSITELQGIPGIGKTVAEKIYRHYHGDSE